MNSNLDDAFKDALVDIDRQLVALEAERDRILAARRILEGDTPASPPANRPKPKPKPRRKAKAKAAGGGTFVCECGRVCSAGPGLAAHRRSCDVAKAADPNAGVGSSPKPTSLPPTVPTHSPRYPTASHACMVCDEKFTGRADLARHRRDRNHYVGAPMPATEVA